MTYQSEVYQRFEKFRLDRNDPNYPPHHEGMHLEEYFCHNFKGQEENTIFIPIHWTAVYNHKVKDGLHVGSQNYNLRQQLQNELNELDEDKHYFIVCTHDDAPKERLPKNTRVFGAGGNSKQIDDPIPLICAPHKNVKDYQKEIFCSFVGSMTHPIRHESLAPLANTHGYFVNGFHWNAEVPKNQVDLFRNVTERSRFCLCPRGYGATSYRLYESMQLGAIPVYISDKHLLPWCDELNWKEFCVLIDQNNLSNIDTIIKGYTETEVQNMRNKLKKVYNENFTLEKTCEHILKRII